VKRSRLLDLYADGEIVTKGELGEKVSRVDEDRRTVEAAIASAWDRRDNVDRLETQKRVVLLTYSALASFALEEFNPEARRDVYERVGLRVAVLKDRPPEIQLTLDPSTLPSVDSVEGVLEGLRDTIGAEALERVHEEFLRPYRETVLDEETGEWTRVGVHPWRSARPNSQALCLQIRHMPDVPPPKTGRAAGRGPWHPPGGRKSVRAVGVARRG
jgi:hypothetical protein